MVDTNVLLQFQPPDQINWTELLHVAAVRLVIPLRVIEELDTKKHGRSQKLSERARELLPIDVATIPDRYRRDQPSQSA